MIAGNPSHSTAPGADESRPAPAAVRARVVGTGESAPRRESSGSDPAPKPELATEAIPKFPVLDLRDFAQAQVEALGLRPAARAAGLGPGTLSTFVHGEIRVPQTETRRKLEIWFWRVRVNDITPSDGAAEIAALRFLVRGVPDPIRDVAAADLLRALESIYAAGGRPALWPSAALRAAFAAP
jgi:hypothetical protein